MAESDPNAGLTETERPRGKGWLRIAIAALVTLAGVAIFGLIARETLLRTEFDLSTLIDDSAGVAPSSPVLLDGIDVGHVVRVTLSGSADPNKTVRILMRFPRHVLNEIPEDSTVAITSGNLLGDKYINISGGTHARHIEPGAEIRSTPTQDIGAVLSRANVPLNQVTDVLTRIDRILDAVNKSEGSLGKFINNPEFVQHLTTASQHQAGMMGDLKNGRGVLARLNEISDEAKRPMARLDAIESDFRQGRGSLGRFLNDPYDPTLTADATATIDEAKRLMADFNAGDRTAKTMEAIRKVDDKLNDTTMRIDAGQGTAGQFVVNPQLRDSLHRVSAELDRFMADFSKHPSGFVQIRFGLF
jgi:phospholipid/cholesterol/gamma-HCH transport system substrate-binding protein